MTTGERKLAYLFQEHSIEEVRAWNRRLKYFRYFRAYGGHANDRDSLDVAIAWGGEEELQTIFRQLEIEVVAHSTIPPQPVAGVSYSRAEYETFPALIPGTRWLEQPGHTRIGESPVFVWCLKDRIMISPKNDSPDVEESTVAAAEAIEPHLTVLADRIIDPPRDTDHYLCVAKHPPLGSG
ncbi:MAG: hypothetical protein P1U68_15115 [Verrucomicrobiales bacterium]|nr:hypothetical protein [Verrucomicrobiales bacterium]